MASDIALECGWGRLIMGHTFADHLDLLTVLGREAAGRRDICMYVREPQVLVSLAPHELFIDPSVTYRLPLTDLTGTAPIGSRGIRVRELVGAADADAVNRLYAAAGMLTVAPQTLIANQGTDAFTYLIAEEVGTERVLGTVTGIDHVAAFADPEAGSSLWCLAVDPQSQRPGVGETLVLTLAARLRAAGARHLDLSVLHDNAPAIALYKKLGFARVQVFCVKRKNPINERLFTPAAEDLARCNPYARIIADEAIRRGIQVEVLDPEWGELATDPRRAQGAHPGVAVRADQCGRDEPVRRQASDPAHPRGCRSAGAPRAPGRARGRRSGRGVPRRSRRGRGQTRPRRAGSRHHRGRAHQRGADLGRGRGPASIARTCSSRSWFPVRTCGWW